MRHSPRAFPLGVAPPVGAHQGKGKHGHLARGADRAGGSACAKAVAVSASPGVGTNATARIRNAGGRFFVGRRRGGRPNTGRMPKSKPSTPGQKARAVSKRGLRPRPLRTRRLRRRVVTQQNLFFPSRLRSTWVLRITRELTSQPRSLLLLCLSSSSSQRRGSRT